MFMPLNKYGLLKVLFKRKFRMCDHKLQDLQCRPLPWYSYIAREEVKITSNLTLGGKHFNLRIPFVALT